MERGTANFWQEQEDNLNSFNSLGQWKRLPENRGSRTILSSSNSLLEKEERGASKATKKVERRNVIRRGISSWHTGGDRRPIEKKDSVRIAGKGRSENTIHTKHVAEFVANRKVSSTCPL